MCFGHDIRNSCCVREDLREQAVFWANRPVNKDRPHWLNSYELNIDGILSSGYRYLHFISAEEVTPSAGLGKEVQ